MKYKQKVLGILSVFALCLSSTSAFADFYAGALASYSHSEYSGMDAKPTLLQMQAGYFFNDYLALEVRYGSSVQRSHDLAIDHLANGFLKLNLPVSERIAMYGLVGYSSVKFDLESKSSKTEQGMSAGIGLHYALDRSNALTFEFVNVLSQDDNRLNNIGLSFQHRF